MRCKMSGTARPCSTIQISQHQAGDSIFLQLQKHHVSLYVPGHCKLSAPNVKVSGKEVVIIFPSLNH